MEGSRVRDVKCIQLPLHLPISVFAMFKEHSGTVDVVNCRSKVYIFAKKHMIVAKPELVHGSS